MWKKMGDGTAGPQKLTSRESLWRGGDRKIYYKSISRAWKKGGGVKWGNKKVRPRKQNPTFLGPGRKENDLTKRSKKRESKPSAHGGKLL